MDKKNLKGWLGCLLWIIGSILLFKGYGWYLSYQKEKRHETYIENRRNDSIRKAFVKDSLIHDSHYQDSMRRFQIWYDSVIIVMGRKIAGVMFDGATEYHTCFHDSISIEDANRLRFVTNKEVEDNDYDWCDVCRDMNLEIRLEDGDYVHVDDIGDYIWEHKEEYEYIFE